MDLALLALLLGLAYTVYRLITMPRRRRRFPGPDGLPIIGNILDLGENPHVSLTRLSKTYGPLMTLRLGSVTTMVISSPQLTKDVLHTHDNTFSNRCVPDFIRIIGHDKHSMAFLPVGPQWRQLRKVAATKMLTAQRLDSTRPHRANKVQKLLKFVHECCDRGEPILVGDVAFTTTMNLITTTLFSVDFADYGSSKLGEFHEAVTALMEEAGKPNIADLFPVFRYFRLPSTGRRGKIYKERLMRIFEGIIRERTQNRASKSEENKDVLDSLLDIIAEEKGYEFDEKYLKHMLLDLFLAGIDTTSNTIEWIMTELLRKPEKMAKAQGEIRQALGSETLVQESDIPKFPYLQAVVKETLRLHPPVPFLLPRESNGALEMHGYVFPKNCQIWINVWGMGRDPSVWPNAQPFQPERFLGRETDVRGRDFDFIPFGGGRRICPGQPLAHRMLHTIVASLLYEFNWKLGEGVKAEDIDMSDKFGITLRKAEPLCAFPFNPSDH